MAATFLLHCELELNGLDLQEGVNDDAMRERLKAHQTQLPGKEYSSVSKDVANLLPLRGAVRMEVPGSLYSKLRSLLKELEAAKFNLEARNLDVFILGKYWGEAFEISHDFANAQTFYEAANRAADCPTGRKALSKVYGKRHMLATTQQFSALLLKKLGRFSEAEQLYLKVLDAPSVPLLKQDTVLHQLAKLYLDTQDVAKLKNLFRRWKKLLVIQKAPADCPVWWQYHQSLAHYQRANRDFAEASTNLAKVVALFETAYGKTSWLLSTRLLDLGGSYMDQLKLEDAYATFERGLKICEQTPRLKASEAKFELEIVQWLSNPIIAAIKQQHLQAHFLGAMGNVRSLQRRDAEALGLFERAFKLNYDRQNPNMGIYMRSYSTVLKRLGRKQESLEFLQRASEHLEKAAGPTQLQTLVVKAAYGEALMENQRTADAAVVLEAARPLALASLGPSNEVTYHIEGLLRVAREALRQGVNPVKVRVPGAARTTNASDPPRFQYPDVLNARCGLCNRLESKEEKFKMCSRCKRAKYCSAECQKSAWKEHKKGCRPLPV